MSTLPKLNGSGMSLILSAISEGFKMALATLSFILGYIPRLFTHFKVSVQKSWDEKKKNEANGWETGKSGTLFVFMCLGRFILSFIKAFSKTIPVWPPKPEKKKK